MRKPLEAPYEGPFLVIDTNDKVFNVLVKGKAKNISIDRLKPAFIENHSDKPRTSICQTKKFVTESNSTKPANQEKIKCILIQQQN